MRSFSFVPMVAVMVFAGYAGEAETQEKHADLAGTWYTASRSELARELDGYLDRAEYRRPDGKIVSLVAPHAGFRFSGPTAGYAFNALKETDPGTVVIVGFTHRRRYPGSVSVFTAPSFVTPLGRAETDVSVTEYFLDYDENMRDIPGAFHEENSVEMLVPFVQAAAPKAKIAIVAISDQIPRVADMLADALYGLMSSRDDVVIVASTDMSHFLTHEDAVDLDKSTIDVISEMDPAKLYSYSLNNEHGVMCGHGAVYAVMKASIKAGADSFEVLDHATSGDVTGDRSRVVGYLSGAFVKSDGSRNEHVSLDEDNAVFDASEREELLRIAREAIGSHLSTGRIPDIEPENEKFKKEFGCFVSLYANGGLRGCIGNIVGTGPFYRSVQEMAVAAAMNDPRFPALSANELDDVTIEISALSPLRKVDDPNEIEMGKHGVMVVMGRRRGVYLPHVATETGWSREEFLDSLCMHKAGIPAHAWRTGQAELYVYTTEVFSEKDLDTN